MPYSALARAQAVKLLAKGVTFYPPPSKDYQRRLVGEGEAPAGAATSPRTVKTRAHAAQNGAAAAASSSPGGGGGIKLRSGRTMTLSADASAGGPAAPAAAAVEVTSSGGGGCPVFGATAHRHPRNGLDGRNFVWRPAPGWPWR